VAVRAPKILAVVSSIDLGHRYGCTPAWWQLWKGLYEADVDLIVTPYRGRAIESPWWRTEPNPCYREGESFDALRRTVARFRGDTLMRRAEENPGESVADRAAREAILRWVNPRWERHLTRILERESDVDAVVVFTVPMAHLVGIPTVIRERFGIPVVFYDADVPMSLPEYGGMDTGFNPYLGADPSEYDLVLSNSEGGIPRLLELGARRADHLFWGADAELFQPLPLAKEHDVVFYGYGDKFRRDWFRDMIGTPSRRLDDIDFVVAGGDFKGELGRARELGWMPVNRLASMISRCRINLNIGRRPHASVYASSTSRIFEMASAGACIVSNPYNGIERWFEPGRELLVVGGAEEAERTYRELLADPAQARQLGRAARERVLDEHTYGHRARRLLDLVGVGSQAVA
jgi:spore maturation protein CgeB